MNLDIIELKSFSNRFSPDVIDVANEVIDNPKFDTWCGGLVNQHHNYTGGLARHTREVVNIAFNAMVTLNLESKIDKNELFLSCIFHDAGKMYDYQENPNRHAVYLNEDGSQATPEPEWIATPHKRLIHHISRSAIIWTHAVARVPELNDKYHDTVLHAILSHHGQREWGSPVMPKSRVAWLLHLSDGISARMADCETTDHVYQE